MKILVVCTANRCRSPMAAALLRRARPDLEVVSAGSLEPGHPASGGSVRAMAARGIELSEHRSQRLALDVVADADLVVAMARRHVRDVAVLDPSAFPKTFTLRELVRRAPAGVGAPDVATWLARLHEGRRAADLLGEDPADDIEDPIGGPDAGYEACAVALESLVSALVDHLPPGR